MSVKIQLFEVGAYRSDFLLWGWMKSEVYKEKVNTTYHDQQHCYHHVPTVKPEAAVAVDRLLMMGIRIPETC